MRYDTRMSGKKNIDAIVIKHNNEEIIFRGVQKVNGGDANQELFEYLNEFFQGCSDTQLDQLWEQLKAGKRILEPGYFDEPDSEELQEYRKNNQDYKFLTSRLEKVINEIYRIIPPSDIAYGATVTGRTEAPKDLMAMSQLGDYPEETTIDNRKYGELVKFAFAAQASFPIVNQLLDHVTNVAGKDFKDAIAGEHLISRIKALTDMEGWKILDTYVRASCLRQEGRRNSIAVLSETKYIDYIVYKGLFNKLCLTFLPSKVSGKNLSKELNSLVEGEIRGGSEVKFKTFNDPKPGSDDQSIPESYRIAQAVNGTDEIAQAEYFTYSLYIEVDGVDEFGDPKTEFVRKSKDFFHDQCLGLGIRDQQLAERLFNTLPRIWNFRLTLIHIKLLQLVFKGDINYNLYPALNYDQLMAAICLAQVKLYELGFEHLAQLCSIVRNPSYPPMFLDDDFKLSTKDREALAEMCDIYIGQSTSSTENILVKAVSDFLDELSTSGWDSTIEPGLLGNEKFVSLMSSGQMYQVDLVPEIKRELLDLIKLSNTLEVE
ncbi:hypothetical protein PQD71_gp128 [Kosakonia phage Kc263]|uniref:Uncharacterized protein n=1 Tax=Kosakonia phage Kc263 TaxID=2863194 RepID=A0AAE7WFA4_9CAUD|nr:hypothetical protein PQD71_gp128 [Kosakonia phage Kc263]QYN80021.1 hypothetical protein [Kosakonia phage Kc263]